MPGSRPRSDAGRASSRGSRPVTDAANPYAGANDAPIDAETLRRARLLALAAELDADADVGTVLRALAAGDERLTRTLAARCQRAERARAKAWSIHVREWLLSFLTSTDGTPEELAETFACVALANGLVSKA